MEPRKLPDREKTRKTLRMIGLALGLWLLGSGLWGLFMTPPKDRAVSGCAELVRVKADVAVTTVQLTTTREEADGWFVSGEVHEVVDGSPVTTYQWECRADVKGENAAITVWTEIG